MSQVLVTESHLEDIADAIREQTNTTDTYTVSEMSDAIRRIVNGGDSVPIGVMVPYGSSAPPTDWLLCDGSAVSRTEYADLFAVIGTGYGEGDGSTTFNLPNKKGRVSVGLDSDDEDFNTIGMTGGEKEHTLSLDEMPRHGHQIAVHNSATGGLYVASSSGVNPQGSSKTYSNGVGGNQPHNNLQPYEVDCWIIKATQSATDSVGISNVAYPVGSVYTTTESSSDPNNLFTGTWELTRTFYGGELIAYACVRADNASSSTSVSKDEAVGFGDSKVGTKTHTIVNYLDGVFSAGNGAIKVQTKGIVDMVEATIALSGLGGDNLSGIWFAGNNNALPTEVTMLPGSGNVSLITGPYGAKYGGTTYEYMYKVDSDTDVTFYVNPKFKPYGGAFQPSISGTVSSLLVKAYAKGGINYVWKRIS